MIKRYHHMGDHISELIDQGAVKSAASVYSATGKYFIKQGKRYPVDILLSRGWGDGRGSGRGEGDGYSWGIGYGGGTGDGSGKYYPFCELTTRGGGGRDDTDFESAGRGDGTGDGSGTAMNRSGSVRAEVISGHAEGTGELTDGQPVGTDPLPGQ